MAAAKYRLALLIQLAGNDVRIAVRVVSVFLRLGDAVIKWVFKDEVYIATRKYIAIATAEAKAGYLGTSSRE